MVTGVQRSSESTTHRVSVARVSALNLRAKVEDRLRQSAKEHSTFASSPDTVAISSKARWLAQATEVQHARRTGESSFHSKGIARFEHSEQDALNRSLRVVRESAITNGFGEEHRSPEASRLQEKIAEVLENPFGRKEPNSTDEEEHVLSSESPLLEKDEETPEELFEKLRGTEEEQKDFLFGLTDQPYRVEEKKDWPVDDDKSDSMSFGFESSFGDRIVNGVEELSLNPFASIAESSNEQGEDATSLEAEESEFTSPNLGISASASMRVTGPPEQIYSVKESKIGAYQLGADGNRRYFVEPEQEGPFGSKGQVAQIIDAYLRQSRGQVSDADAESAGVNTLG